MSAASNDAAEVVRRVAAMLGSTRAAVCGRSKNANDMRARRACAVALRRRGLSLPAVGQALGGKDHSTIAHALRRAKEAHADDAMFDAAVLAGVAVGSEDAEAPRSRKREAIVGILSQPGRVPDAAVDALWVLLATLAGCPMSIAEEAPPAPAALC